MVNCYGIGDDCIKAGVYDEVLLRTYVENDKVSDYFIKENWQSQIPALTNHTDIVNLVISQNPKCIIDNKGTFIILKDRNLPFSQTNILFAIEKNLSIPN